MQRTAVVAGFQLTIERSSLVDRPIAVEHDPGVDLRFPFVTLVEATLQDINARSASFAQSATVSRDGLIGRREQTRVVRR
jgi:hypothetical protein